MSWSAQPDYGCSHSPLQMKANTARPVSLTSHYLRYGAVAQLRERYPAPLGRHQVPVTAAACTARDFAERPTDSSLVMLIAEHSTKDPDRLIMWSLSTRPHAGTCPGGVRVMHVQRLNPPFSAAALHAAVPRLYRSTVAASHGLVIHTPHSRIKLAPPPRATQCALLMASVTA